MIFVPGLIARSPTSAASDAILPSLVLSPRIFCRFALTKVACSNLCFSCSIVSLGSAVTSMSLPLHLNCSVCAIVGLITLIACHNVVAIRGERCELVGVGGEGGNGLSRATRGRLWA